ncbi:MAG: glycosyltransferase [Endomicrobiaceae bacterium]
MSKISIIIPVYNAEEYLKQCLESVSTQTFKDFECICINDASTDNSLKILKKYSDTDERFKIITNINSGVSAARNAGLNSASARYLTFVDADDWISEDYLEKLYTSAIDNNADITVGHHVIYNNTDKVFKKESNSKKMNSTYNNASSKNCRNIQVIFKIANTSRSVWCKLYKTDIIKNNRIYFFENIKIEEDFSFNVMAFLYAQKIVIADKELYVYRKQISSLTSNNGQLRIESLKSYITLTKELLKRNFNDYSVNNLYIDGFLRLTGKISKNVSYDRKQELLNTVKKHFIYLINMLSGISGVQKLKLEFGLFAVKILKERSFCLFRLLKNII